MLPLKVLAVANRMAVDPDIKDDPMFTLSDEHGRFVCVKESYLSFFGPPFVRLRHSSGEIWTSAVNVGKFQDYRIFSLVPTVTPLGNGFSVTGWNSPLEHYVYRWFASSSPIHGNEDWNHCPYGTEAIALISDYLVNT